MLSKKYINWIKEISHNYTKTNQILQAVQEMGELIQALTKNVGNGGEDNESDIIKETADVLIMLIQIIEIYNIDSEKLLGAIEYKVLRQRDRINNEKRENKEINCMTD